MYIRKIIRCKEDKNEYFSELAELSIGKNDVSHLVCSHGHIDHIGGIGLFPNTEIFLDCDHHLPNTSLIKSIDFVIYRLIYIKNSKT